MLSSNFATSGKDENDKEYNDVSDDNDDIFLYKVNFNARNKEFSLCGLVEWGCEFSLLIIWSLVWMRPAC